MSWEVVRERGAASTFHGRDLPDPPRRALWLLEVDRPALVLGSAQRDDVVDAEACARTGTEVVRRRSGGGAVHLVPGEVLWADVIVPPGDPLWDDDVVRAARWVGRWWVDALGGAGEVHEGGLVRTDWSGLVCFGGLGPGEVVVDGRKVVGVSQRRTRRGARFQCAALARWAPQELLDLLALAPAERGRAAGALADVAAGVPLAGLADRLVAALPA